MFTLDGMTARALLWRRGQTREPKMAAVQTGLFLTDKFYANSSTLMMFAFVTIVQKNLNPSKLFEDAPTSFACKCLHMCHML
jgi:hypothetical protein